MPFPSEFSPWLLGLLLKAAVGLALPAGVLVTGAVLLRVGQGLRDSLGAGAGETGFSG
jgi:hypothetical protein